MWSALARSRVLTWLNVVLVAMLVMVFGVFFLCYIQQLFLNGANSSFGRPGVECYCQHDSGAAVIQLQFLINEVSKMMHIFHNSDKIECILFNFSLSEYQK